jgi:putative addiction module component (TIGR02574 family)
MSPTVEQLKITLRDLPSAERAELAEYLLDSLDPDEQGIRSEWLAVAEQRMSKVRAGQVVGIPAEAVLNSLQGLNR